MLITNPSSLKKYHAEHRIWQGIPGIEHTKNGRTFVSFYSGNTKETYGNYAAVMMSDDETNYGEPIAVAYKEGNLDIFSNFLEEIDGRHDFFNTAFDSQFDSTQYGDSKKEKNALVNFTIKSSLLQHKIWNFMKKEYKRVEIAIIVYNQDVIRVSDPIVGEEVEFENN